jgi:hypothetical protein
MSNLTRLYIATQARSVLFQTSSDRPAIRNEIAAEQKYIRLASAPLRGVGRS